MPRFRPKDTRELASLLAWAAGEGEALEVIAGGTKRGLGRPIETPHMLDVASLTGIEAYEPEELVLTARPGTPRGMIVLLVLLAALVVLFHFGGLS